MVDIAPGMDRYEARLVPDEPGQLTSDHGWDLDRYRARLKVLCRELRDSGIRVSLFVDHDNDSIALARDLGADRVELYTEPYALAFGTPEAGRVLDRFQEAARRAREAGLGVNAGHDLNLANLGAFLRIPSVLEVSIGHALTGECLDTGIEDVTRRYLAIVRAA